jgi:hypothetical protein
MAHKQSSPQDSHQLTGFLANALPKLAFLIGGLGLAACALFYTQNPHRFFFSYLTAFMFFLSISLGGLFFIIIHYLVRAGWNVVLRRIQEHLMKNIQLLILLFIPLLFGLHHLYEWTHHAVVASDHLLLKKSPYLNIPFFMVRAAFYFGVWYLLSRTFFSRSTTQDKTGDESLTLKSQTTSTYGVLLFAITLTFAAIDWVMSLTPHWYSTMFGVYFFAGSAVVSLSATSLISLILRKYGFLKNTIRIDHFHDIGKFLYGFNVFWAYIAFSQYFLIWYANIPEETLWFADHFRGSWNSVGILLAVGHFAVPFLLFMSRHAKKNLPFHAVMVSWFLIIHFVDIYWVIMPNISKAGVDLAPVDLAALLGIGGIYIGALFNRMKKFPLYPISDPRLEESKNLEVL